MPAFVTFHFGLLVTGRGEERFLDSFFRSLAAPGEEGSRCIFQTIRRVPQLSPITSPKKLLKMSGRGQNLPSRDEEIGLAARAYLKKSESHFVVLIDDLEHDRRDSQQAIFDRYREAFDTVLGESRWRASVHFFVNMIEAYYLADVRAVNEVLKLSLQDYEADVEQIRHPKNI